MRARILTAAAVALLVAAAFFLPEMLLAWGDSQSLDVLQMESQDEEREGFAESIQLTVAEKVMLLRSGRLTRVNLEQEVLVNISFAAEDGEASVRYYASSEEATLQSEEAAGLYPEDARELWEERANALRSEIGTLQTLGGLPELWKSGGDPDFAVIGIFLLLDPDTRMNFQVYQISLLAEDYTLNLLVDVDSGRILSLELHWSGAEPPNWGPRGASNFGSAWRDYWRMDSVSTGWYTEHIRNLLESADLYVSNSGDYAAHDQITFMYDGQSLSIPLDCRGIWSRYIAISWNQ